MTVTLNPFERSVRASRSILMSGGKREWVSIRIFEALKGRDGKALRSETPVPVKAHHWCRDRKSMTRLESTSRLPPCGEQHV